MWFLRFRAFGVLSAFRVMCLGFRVLSFWFKCFLGLGFSVFRDFRFRVVRVERFYGLGFLGFRVLMV